MAEPKASISELREQLLVYLADRLSTGEVLVTAEQFVAAAGEGFSTLTGDEVTDAVQQQLAEFLAVANAEDPTQLLAPGVENWVSLSVLAQVRKAGWGITEVQEQGTQIIRDFMRGDRTQALLDQLGVKSQMGELVANLDNYISLGRIIAEDAERLRKSQQVDKAMREGKIDNEKGSKIRNTLMSGNARDRIDKGVKEALDFSVAYLQVFEALGRIDVGFDGALKFLVRHGSAINEDPSSQSEVPAALGVVVEALMMDSEVLRPLIDLMDRKESEVRMIAARLPPYSLIIKRDQGRVERVAIDDEFITQLRQMSVDDVAEELHSADRKKRARPAAAMLTLTVLINRLIKRTPFRKELRLLKINLVIEEFYHATEDVDIARQRATDFLKGRLRSLFPDMSREETEELQRRGEEMVQRVEDKVLAERAARKAKQAGKTTGGEEGDEENDVLTEEEQRKGVQIQRVSVRIAGRVRQMRYRIMLEKEGSERYVIGRKDPESGEIAPVLRRGKPRYVDRARDGSWELARE